MPGAWDQRGDVLWLEAEVRRDGRERGATAEGDGRREPSSEASGGGAESARRSAEGRDPKKRLELAGLRGDVAFVSEQFRLSERTACKLLGVERSSYRYEPRPDRNAELRDALVQLARQKPRYGYRRLHALLCRRGHEVNVKRVYRLYVEEGLMVRRKRRKRLVGERTAEPRLTRANQEWAMDFIVDWWRAGGWCASSAWSTRTRTSASRWRPIRAMSIGVARTRSRFRRIRGV